MSSTTMQDDSPVPRRKKAKTSTSEEEIKKEEDLKHEPEPASLLLDNRLGTLDFIVAGVTLCVVLSVLLKMLKPLFFWHDDYDDYGLV